MEIFSIFIGVEKFEALQVYGCVEVSSIEDECTYYIFNREANNAFGLLEEGKTIPVLDGSLVYQDYDSLKMKIDLKDVENRLHIRGYIDWECMSLEFGTKWLNKQLCSVVEGEHGFVAIHYSIFPEAVQANVEVLCKPKHGNGYVDAPSRVYGTIVAQYNNFEYTSRYAKDYYRVVLFQRNQEDPAQTSGNGMISLSRSMVVVPLNSSIVVETNLWIGDEQVLLRFTTNFPITTNDMSHVTMEHNDYSLHIYMKWVEYIGAPV